MARTDRLATAAILIVTLALALPCIGHGPANGDQAVYLHQAASGAYFERWTHVGYVLFLSSSLAADILNLVCGAVAILLLGRTPAAAFVTAGLILPWLPWGEVDLPWFAAYCGALQWPVVGLVAVAISPTALAAVPWMRSRGLWLVGAALLLAALSMGDWVVGQRGVAVLHWRPDPLAQLLPLVVPLLLTRAWRAPRELLLLSPLLLAPGDVPAFLIAAPFLANRAVWTPWWSLHGLLALFLYTSTATRIAAEHDEIERLAATVRAGDVLSGSWSRRVRVSLRVAGRPDALLSEGQGVPENHP